MAAPPLVMVHGFTQTRRTWDLVRRDLGPGVKPVTVELPGHGRSELAFEPFSLTAEAIGRAGGEAAYMGYSMGGRLCLRLALDRPEIVRALVLVSSSPGIADPEARRERRRSDARLADDIEAAGTGDFLARWLAQPLFEATAVPPEELAARQANRAADLARALRLLGTGSQESLWDRLGQLSIPVLVMVGEHDAKFRDIADRMVAALGPAPVELACIPGAGHAVPLDRPAECARAAEDFLARHGVLTE